MNKREFAGLANLATKVVKENLNRRVEELKKEKDRTYSEAIKALREFVFEELKKNPELLKLKLDNISAHLDTWHSDRDSMHFTISYHQDLAEAFEDRIPEEILEKFRRFFDLKEEIARLNRLSWQVKSRIKEWKLVAIEKGTLNKEPFPAELWPFLTDKLKEVLTPPKEGENNEVEQA